MYRLDAAVSNGHRSMANGRSIRYEEIYEETRKTGERLLFKK